MKLNELLHLPVPLVLASQSPRRLALLSQIGLDAEVCPAHVDEESLAADRAPEEYASHLALLKAQAVAQSRADDVIVLGADTIVVCDGHILNKPIDAADAHRMLRMLSGRTHTVITAVALVRSNTHMLRQSSTKVRFRELSDTEIAAYIAGGSPMDKAGSYGIQDDYGAVFVEHIEGCYYTIVGLPLELLFLMLGEFCGQN